MDNELFESVNYHLLPTKQTYLSRQNERVKMTTTLMISRRPMSMSSESIHLTAAGRTAHDMVGPISRPRVGPTLLAQLRAMVMELVLSTPATIMMK